MINVYLLVLPAGTTKILSYYLSKVN